MSSGYSIQAKKFVVKHIKTKFAEKVEEEREKVRLDHSLAGHKHHIGL